jgi:hypothetical protein
MLDKVHTIQFQAREHVVIVLAWPYSLGWHVEWRLEFVFELRLLLLALFQPRIEVEWFVWKHETAKIVVLAFQGHARAASHAGTHGRHRGGPTTFVAPRAAESDTEAAFRPLAVEVVIEASVVGIGTGIIRRCGRSFPSKSRPEPQTTCTCTCSFVTSSLKFEVVPPFVRYFRVLPRRSLLLP